MNLQYEYWFTDFVEVPETNKCYFFGANIKGFFCMDKYSGKVVLLDELKEHPYRNDMYGRGIYVNGKIYFPPLKINTLAVFEIQTQKLEFTELYSDELQHKELYCNSVGGHFILNKNDYIYIINRQYPIITRVDTKTMEKKFIVNNQSAETFYLEIAHNNSGDICYFPQPETNRIFKFDMQNEFFDVIELSEFDNLKISSCYCDNDRLTILPVGECCIYSFEIRTKTCRRYKIEMESAHSKNRNFITKFEGNYYVLPLVYVSVSPECDYMYKFDDKMNLIEKKEVFGKYKYSNKMSIYNEYGSEWYIFFDIESERHCNIYRSNRVIYAKLELDKLCLTEKDVSLPEGKSKDDISDMIVAAQVKDELNDSGLLFEDELCGLKEYISMLNGEL